MQVSRNADPNRDFANLSEGEQREVAARLLAIKDSGWKPFWCPDPKCDGMPHEDSAGLVDPNWAHNHARKDQRLLPWQKAWVLALLSGRGAGKTTTGVEFVTLSSRKGLDGAILGRRGTELVNTHVATILERAHPEFIPEYRASKDILEWPNGATTYLFSAEKPENIRSVNLSWAWVDEAAHMPLIETAWSNLKLATRVESPGNPIHILVTSTPTPTQWMMDMEDDPDVVVRRVSTYANKANLSADFIRDIEKEYEGTRLGRQELHGEVLRDVEGALWHDGLFRHLRFTSNAFEDLLDSMDDIVVAVDPAGSKGPRSDATGIIAVGIQHTDAEGSPMKASQFFVLGDATVKGTPTEWAAQVYALAGAVRARRIIAEKNYGGSMVEQVLRDYAKLNVAETVTYDDDEYRIEVAHAVKSKETRAEGVVGKYEQGRVSHVVSPGVYGDLSLLEKEQCGWVPKSRGGRLPSPNRVDALVWAIRAAEANVKFRATTATAQGAFAKLKRVSSRRGKAHHFA